MLQRASHQIARVQPWPYSHPHVCAALALPISHSPLMKPSYALCRSVGQCCLNTVVLGWAAWPR